MGAYDLRDENGVWSTAYLYYSSANGGTNCASLVAKKFAGPRHYMSVGINVSGRSGYKEDEGQYSSYAGPVSQTGTDGHCINLLLWETVPGVVDGGRTVDNVACG